MDQKISWTLGADVRILGVQHKAGEWIIEAEWIGEPTCPRCGTPARARHSWYLRRLHDLAVQGIPATVKLRVARWRCQNPACERRIFAARTTALALPSAQRTRRHADIVQILRARSALTNGRGGEAGHSAPSLSTCRHMKSWTCCLSGPRQALPNGCDVIRPYASSAEIAMASMRRLVALAHRRPCKSPTASI